MNTDLNILIAAVVGCWVYLMTWAAASFVIGYFEEKRTAAMATPVRRCGSMSGLGERCCDAYGHDGPHHDSGERTWTHTPRYAGG